MGLQQRDANSFLVDSITVCLYAYRRDNSVAAVSRTHCLLAGKQARQELARCNRDRQQVKRHLKKIFNNESKKVFRVVRERMVWHMSRKLMNQRRMARFLHDTHNHPSIDDLIQAMDELDEEDQLSEPELKQRMLRDAENRCKYICPLLTTTFHTLTFVV